jgi:hypothetical protein
MLEPKPLTALWAYTACYSDSTSILEEPAISIFMFQRNVLTELCIITSQKTVIFIVTGLKTSNLASEG